MRDEPFLVDRIAREAAAEMIVDAAFADALHGMFDELEETRLAGAYAGAPEAFVHRGIGKFGRAAQPAVHGTERAGNLACNLIKVARGDHDAAGRPRGFAHALH